MPGEIVLAAPEQPDAAVGGRHLRWLERQLAGQHHQVTGPRQPATQAQCQILDK